jgi:hypothetical protein
MGKNNSSGVSFTFSFNLSKTYNPQENKRPKRVKKKELERERKETEKRELH